ncbi:hypothetical protein BGZ97_007777, partial [Linnemannia gamsii]
MLASSASLLLLSALAATATAEIAFTSPPPNSVYRPGDSFALTWTIRPPNGTVPVNTDPFDLQLRAATLQRYTIQTAVAQSALTLQVQIPADVTGGLHSFYADYRNVQPNQKNGESSRQFNIPIAIVSITSAAPNGSRTSSGVPLPTSTSTPTESGGGLSAGALGGIIGGVIVLLMAVAFLFLGRHRRRVAEDRKDGTSRSMDGKNGLSKEGGGQHQDKESLTRSAGSAGGLPEISAGREAVPLKLTRPVDGSPRSQNQNLHHQQNQNQQQHQNQHQQRPTSPTATRNPFEAPEMMIHPNSPTGAPSPRQQHNNQNHQYQPPQLPPPQQSPFGTPPQQYSGMPPNPLMGGQQGPGGPRNQSPYHQNSRDSFESEIESAYDPHPRMSPPVSRNNGPSPMNNGNGGSPLGYSSSTGSSRYPHPNPSSPLNHQAAQQDREILAVAAAVAAAASPAPAHRQVQNQQQQRAGASPRMPNAVAGSPRMKEIEMQQFDVQQHHQEQQQKMLQRQQQQQQQQQQQRSAQSTPTPLPAAQKSMNPTQFDDKAEFSDSEDDDEEEEYQNPFQKPQNQQYPQPDVKPTPVAPFTPAPPAAALAHPVPPPPLPPVAPAAPVVEDGPAYNGYRDTIFGAYANTQDDDSDEDEPTAPIVRKKSVKFTGVPKSGPIVLPNHEAAKEHQQQRQQIKQQQAQAQGQQGYQEEGEDSDEFYSQDDEEIRARMLETAESPANVNTAAAAAANNNNNVNGGNNVLSPIRSPGEQQQQYSNNPYQLGEDEDSTDDEDYMNDPYGAYTAPPQAPYAQQGHQQGVEESPRLNGVSPVSDDDFFGDVLAAVEKTA